jgi:hypothetical protein
MLSGLGIDAWSQMNIFTSSRVAHFYVFIYTGMPPHPLIQYLRFTLG